MSVSQPDIKSDLVQLAIDMKASELSDDAWAEKMATIIADAILTAEGVPNTTTDPLLDSLGGNVTGKTKMT